MTTSIQPSILLSITHPESPKAKDDDDEVDDISQEHERVDVGGGSILSVEDTLEETLSRSVDTLNTAEENRTA